MLTAKKYRHVDDVKLISYQYCIQGDVDDIGKEIYIGMYPVTFDHRSGRGKDAVIYIQCKQYRSFM